MRAGQLFTLCVVPFSVAAILVSLATNTTAAQPRPALDAILSAPFPYDLVASPTGEIAAWVTNDRGARNVWVAAVGDGIAAHERKLTDYKGDEGADLGELTWSADASELAYTRGGGLEEPTPVNPASFAAGPPLQEVWVVDARSGALHDLGAGHAPVFAPRGDTVAFIRGKEIWLDESALGKAAHQIVNDRGDIGQMLWSPDGRHLAFLSLRDGHDVLGVYDLGEGHITWLTHDFSKVANFVWSPDSSQIVYVNLPIGGTTEFYKLFSTNRVGDPWSLQVVNIDDGQGHEIWRARPGPGSVYRRLENGPNLFWTVDGAIIFPWEGSGWLRLYALQAAGHNPVRAVTPDAAEVFAASLTADHRGMFYSSNTGDEDRRHIWLSSPVGAGAKPVTEGSGIEDLPVAASVNGLFALRADARAPLTPIFISGPAGRPQPLSKLPAEFPIEALVSPIPVKFNSPDGPTVHGQLFLPPDAYKGKMPTIIFFHGGPQRQMLLGWNPMSAYSHMYGLNQFLATRGYIVLSVNYRGSTGYGLSYREPDSFAAGGSAERFDIAGALRFLAERDDVDEARVGVWGMSYGGVMTGLAATRYPGAFCAAVDIAGVSDWKTFIPYLTAPGASQAAAALAYQSSPVSQAASWRTPALLVHGDDDHTVPASQTIELVEALRANSEVAPEQLMIPNEVHDFLLHQTWLTVLSATSSFFDRHMDKCQGAPVRSQR